MGREPRSATAAATQVLVWTLCCCWTCGYPQRPTQAARPVLYPGTRIILKNSTMPRSALGGKTVVFPDETNTLAPSLDMNGNPACSFGTSKASFCEKVDDYPDNEIRNLIRIDKTSFQELFGPVGINSRKTINQEDLEEDVLCKRQRQIFFPKMAKNDDNLWRYVINDVDYVQGVEAEVCVKEGKACSYVQGHLPGGHEAICRQRFSYKRLLAIEPDKKTTYMDSFSFPSCCSCYVKVPPVYGRSGGGKSSTGIPNNK